MRFNSLAFRLFATAAAWTLLVLPIAGFIIYGLYRDDVQASFDGQLQKLVNAITVDSMGAGQTPPLPPTNLYEPLFEVTHSGWYWQITPMDDPAGRKLVSASLATASLPSPAAKGIGPDASGARWMDAKGPIGEPLRLVEVIDTLGHEPGKPSYSIVVAGPQDWLDHLVANFRYRLTTALALAGLGLLAVTLFQVRFGLLPLRQIERGLAVMSKDLGGRTHCFADSFTLADIAAGYALGYLDQALPELDWRKPYPNLSQLDARLAMRDSFRNTRPAAV